MDNKTVQYKRTLRGSVGAGVSALFNGNGRRYYILEHKDASKYHKAGESQKIIIDQIELGRDSNCQVRFDETFQTVSRRHAAIIKDGDRWKLVQLSKTNSTFLNGRPVENEWYLENGDEIQLSVGGPRMGFIVPVGKQSLVSSIKMTERLELFRKQALRPYKTAIASLAVLLVLASSLGGYWLYNQNIDILHLNDEQQKQAIALNMLEHNQDSVANLMENQRQTWTRESQTLSSRITATNLKIKPEVSTLLKSVADDVYFIQIKYIGSIEGKDYLLGGASGTAFLLNNGRLVTARHCISERYDPDLSWNMQHIQACGGTFRKEVTLYTPAGKSFSISDKSFVTDERYDIEIPYTKVDKNGEKLGTYQIKLAYPSNNAKAEQMIFGTDWAYANIGRTGKIVANENLSKNLTAGTIVHVLGFPKALGVDDGDKLIESIYNSMTVSRNGLNEANCIMVSSGIDHGNSGGPVFAMVGNRLEVIGIVSRGDFKSDHYNHLVPICNLR